MHRDKGKTSLGGAFYGVDAILAKLAMRELIEQMADDLLALSAA
jgi:hypothetical protein